MSLYQASCTDSYEIGLIPVADALTRILEALPALSGYECVPIEQAKGRTLHQAVVAPFNVPRQTNSAVDGYALRSQDLALNVDKFAIAGQAFAGRAFTGELSPRHCLRIMTGAIMPDGLDTVIMQEHAVVKDGYIIIDPAFHKAGQNSRKAGEDLQQDALVLPAGRFLTAADIGLLASLGLAEIAVRRCVRVAIASTGNEVCGIGQPLYPGAIYDSNRYLLQAILARPDIEMSDLGILQDDPEILLQSFRQASQYADIIVTTGGVSVGEADFTKTVLQSSGQINFWKVAIKPGRPLAFGKLGKTAFFGLPGNPVAVMVTFYQFVLPALERMLGITDKPIAPIFWARALEDLRKKPGRTEIQRGIIAIDEQGFWTVKTTGKQGSGILRSMSLANALIILDHDRANVKAGDWVKVQALAGLF
jgi:molybdopterin molybdotransferase